jgi:hypothetical protein
MAESKGREAWNHTAAVMAMLANVHRDPKKTRAFRPKDFHPYHAGGSKSGIPLRKGNWELLKKVFVDPPAGQTGRKGVGR